MQQIPASRLRKSIQRLTDRWFLITRLMQREGWKSVLIVTLLWKPMAVKSVNHMHIITVRPAMRRKMDRRTVPVAMMGRKFLKNDMIKKIHDT
ncbi:MAG: hypothetical protein C0615_06385 [Desulfuromonas sp.]|nr:MAG: hypothetical protein C0615_06385 [Desulfuromonas sp.]